MISARFFMAFSASRNRACESFREIKNEDIWCAPIVKKWLIAQLLPRSQWLPRKSSEAPPAQPAGSPDRPRSAKQLRGAARRLGTNPLKFMGHSPRSIGRANRSVHGQEHSVPNVTIGVFRG